MKARQQSLLVAGVSAVVVVAAGAFVYRFFTGGPMDGYTEEEALARVDEHIHDAAAQIDPEPELEDQNRSAGHLTCELGGRLVESGYWLRGVPQERNAEVFDTLHDYWKDNGYRINTDQRDRFNTDPPDRVNNDPRDREWLIALQVRHRDDGFSVSLRQNAQGDLGLSSSSPCIELLAGDMASYTEDEAYLLNDERIREAIDQISPRPQVGDRFDRLSDRDCLEDGIRATSSVTLSAVDRDRHDDIVDQFHDYWVAKGYEVVTDGRELETGTPPTIRVAHPEDGFTLRLAPSVADPVVRLEASSPCIELREEPGRSE